MRLPDSHFMLYRAISVCIMLCNIHLLFVLGDMPLGLRFFSPEFHVALQIQFNPHTA